MIEQDCTCGVQQLEKRTVVLVDLSTAFHDHTSAVEENFPVGSKACKTSWQLLQ